LDLPNECSQSEENESQAAEFNLLSDSDYFLSTYLTAKNLTQKGKDVTLKILEAARQVLVEKGYGAFSLREVSREAGISLSNLQYYYPTRDDLMEDLLPLIFSIYDARHNQLSFATDLSPNEKLVSLTKYLLNNIREQSIYKLFFELWALARRSEYAADLLSRMYEAYCQRLEKLIAEVSPEMPPDKRTERAILIAFQIEGLMVFLNTRQSWDDSSVEIDSECIEQIQRLASWP